jgi:hypothetical protein
MKKIDLNQNFTHQNLLNEILEYCYMNDIEYIDGVVDWCEKNNVEVEYIADIIKNNENFKLKIQYEAEDLNILKKPKRLPL